ncbi:MAG: matrixin family metalloprotease [Acidobacteria bacterium]|nr:matrixin family metalloprotease [Acidobacteriota bacterium]
MVRLYYFTAALMFCVLLGSQAFGSFVFSSSERGSTEIRWTRRVIRVAVSNSLSDTAPNIKKGSNVTEAVKRSLATWENELGVRFQVVSSDAANVSPTGNSGDGISLITAAPTAENLQIFGENAQHLPAMTRIFFDRRGRITEADIVLNPIFQFSTDGTFGTYDLESVLVHEIGHLLGLDHPPISAGVMSSQVARNGLYGVEQLSGRQLSFADVAQLRSIYGSTSRYEECCGEIRGKVTREERTANDDIIWLEDAETGRIAGSALVGDRGQFSVKGLSSGLYSIYLRTTGDDGSVTDEFIETIELATGESFSMDVAPQNTFASNTLEFLGAMGQMSNVPVQAEPGGSLLLQLAGRVEKRPFSIGSSSPYIMIENDPKADQSLSERLGVVSVEIRIDEETPAGHYSIFIRSSDGSRSYMPGAIVVSESRETSLLRNPQKN